MRNALKRKMSVKARDRHFRAVAFFTRYTTFLLVVASLALANRPVQASELPSGLPAIAPATNVESKHLDTMILSMITVYQMFTDQPLANIRDGGDFKKINFFFASGENYIVDQRVNPAAIPIFGEDTTDWLGTFDTQSEVCYVQRFVFSNDFAVLLAVHNEDNNSSEDVLRCLTLALWKYTFGSVSGVNITDWRTNFSNLLNNKGN